MCIRDRVYRLFVFDPAVLAQAGEEEALVARVEDAINAELAQSLEQYCQAGRVAEEEVAATVAAMPHAAVPLEARRRLWER